MRGIDLMCNIYIDMHACMHALHKLIHRHHLVPALFHRTPSRVHFHMRTHTHIHTFMAYPLYISYRHTRPTHMLFHI